MQIVIDISKEKYDEIMAMDWKNCRRFFDEEIWAIHDGKVLPAGHGRLIDGDELRNEIASWHETEPPTYVPNYDAYARCINVIDEYLEGVKNDT